mmetsp:Transcript_4819/g.9296  ORF Transcript_4819/g.9296 Transcript_4819/m.9296 type:complete len:106 (-) Transcript_4819:1737-2054(-)
MASEFEHREALDAIFNTFISPMPEAETEALVAKHAKSEEHAADIRWLCSASASSGGAVDQAINTIMNKVDAESKKKADANLELIWHQLWDICIDWQNRAIRSAFP